MLRSCLALCLLFLAYPSATPADVHRRKAEGKPRAIIEATVNFVMGIAPENPVQATLHLKNVGTIMATNVRLLNSVGISADEPTRAEKATYEHAIQGSTLPNPAIGNINVGQRDSMELHVPKLVPSQFERFKAGRDKVYVVGVLDFT